MLERQRHARGHYLVSRLIEKLDNEMTQQVIDSQPQQAQDELLMELEMKKIELQKERVKISTLRNELNKTIREESRKELFYANLRDAVINNSLEPIQFEPCYHQQANKNIY